MVLLFVVFVELFFCCFFFFFSSRRRHTRCLSDWSSDVCSSDLEAELDSARAESSSASRSASWPASCWLSAARSEERRVGKECRARWSREHSKKKKVKNDDKTTVKTREQQYKATG